MNKIWQLMLSSILLTSFAVGALEVYDDLSASILANSPFHPDIKISNTATKTIRQEGNLNASEKEEFVGETLVKWTDYATSWDQFKQYYKTINLKVSGYADGKEASKKTFSNLNLTITNLAKQTAWHSKAILMAPGSTFCLAYTNKSFTWGSYDQAGVYYDAIVADSNIKIRFYLWTKAHQAGTGSIWTESYLNYQGGTISSSWSLNSIKDSLDSALAKQIDFESSYSGSLEDPSNINDPTGNGHDLTTLINAKIAKVLGDEYQNWVDNKYIQPFSFSNATRQATTVFKFPDPVTKLQQVWAFRTPINISLSKDYWGKSLNERLRIEPGKIVNPEDSTKGMVEDTPIQLEPSKGDTDGGTLQYHTTAHVVFDGLEDSTEWMTVNGQPVEVLNNRFIFEMVDNRVENGEKAVNKYEIVVHHKDKENEAEYRITYVIANLVPTLQGKWYAWNPEQNPNQKKLITPTLPNGKDNPDYDREINEKTGTKTQIIWVKKKSQYPFPLDPVDKEGRKIEANINPEDYDLGFIAEGSVAGMGVQQFFNEKEVSSVSREAVDNALNELTNANDRQKLTEINADSENKYWSWQGTWHYITKTLDSLAYEKYIVIGAKYEDNYPRFLDVLNDANVAVDFWTTIHGIHLKNYLAIHKNLDSKDIAQLNYEQVSSYWKEYTSGIISQWNQPDPNPADYQDLGKITFWTVKMNLTTVDLIKEEIIRQIKNQLSKTNLEYIDDYEFNPFDDKSIEQLLNYDSEGNAEMSLNIKATSTSTKAIGENSFNVVNNTHFDPNEVFDLSSIEPWTIIKNFSERTIAELRDNWILGSIADKLKNAKADLVYEIDYEVKPLDDEILQEFLDSKERFSLEITIAAQDSSLKAINGTTLEMVNDPDAEIAPTEPPDPDPDPKPNPDDGSWITKKANLIIISVVTVIVTVTVATFVFFKYRLKKGIGGKKTKKQISKKVKEAKDNKKQS